MRTIALALLASVCLAVPPQQAGYLGVRLEPAQPSGVRLAQVFPDGPAAKAGLEDGDVVVRVGTEEIGGVPALAGKLRAGGPGTKLELTIVRGGEERTVAVTLGVHPRVLLEQPDTSEGMHAVAIERDVSYVLGDAEPHERHRLDLYLPKRDEPFPVVLWIHAGAWSYGDRAREAALAMRFAERGVGFAPMSYRLSSRAWNEPDAPKEGVRHPAHAEDCAMAFAWLKKRFENRPLFLSGHSCGAHLAALLGTDARYLKNHGLSPQDVAGVIAIGGGYDLVKYHAILANGIGGEPGLGKEKADAHLQWIFGDTKKDWIAASPSTYLEGCTTRMLIVAEKGPSMRQYTKDFEEAVAAAGVTSIRFLYMFDRTHGQNTPLMSRKAPDPVRDAAIAFIRE